MKVRNAIIAVATLFAACSPQPSNTSTVQDAVSDVVEPPAFDVNDLPGKPEALAFRIEDTDNTMINFLTGVAPGRPMLAVTTWKKEDLSDKQTINLLLQGPCTANSAHWTCIYGNTDTNTGLTYSIAIRYYVAPIDAYKAISVTWGAASADGDSVFPPKSGVNASNSGCDPDDPASCGWN